MDMEQQSVKRGKVIVSVVQGIDNETQFSFDQGECWHHATDAGKGLFQSIEQVLRYQHLAEKVNSVTPFRKCGTMVDCVVSYSV